MDISVDTDKKKAGILSSSETKLLLDETFTTSNLGFDEGFVIFDSDRNLKGGGIMLVVKNK